MDLGEHHAVTGFMKGTTRGRLSRIAQGSLASAVCDVKHAQTVVLAPARAETLPAGVRMPSAIPWLTRKGHIHDDECCGCVKALVCRLISLISGSVN